MWKSLGTVACLALLARAEERSVPITSSPPKDVSDVLAKDWQSFSIEFAFFPDYAGNNTHPNVFTNNLFANLAKESGTDAIIRIGGNTGDHITYVADQKDGIINNWNYAYNADQPQNSSIGPAFWQSLNVLKNTKYIPQLNFYMNTSNYLYNMESMVDQTLKQVPSDRIHLFEIGNENDYGALSGFRPPTWTAYDYVSEWHNRSESLQAQHGDKLSFFAPSFCCFGVTTNYSYFSPITIWNSSFHYDKDGWIDEVSQHGYISGVPGHNITLQGTLMNHTNIREFVQNFINISDFHIQNGRYFTLGETNSISGQGAVGVSDVFGAALFDIDYALYTAANNIRRMHWHQGTAYRYASWMPIALNGSQPYTKPPYYANMFIARFLGDSGKTQLAHYLLEDADENNVAYAAYEENQLKRVALLNMQEYNATKSGSTKREADHYVPRPYTTFKFPSPKGVEWAKVSKLWAPEAQANQTVTFDGYSYAYELAKGKPVKVRHDESYVRAEKGQFSVDVEATGAVIVTLI